MIHTTNKLFKLAAAILISAPLALIAESEEFKDLELPSYTSNYLLPQLSYSRKNHSWGKSKCVLYGITYIHEHEEPNALYYQGSITAASAHVKLKFSKNYFYNSRSQAFNPIMGFVGGRLGHTWKLSSNCMLTPYVLLNSEFAIPVNSGAKRVTGHVYGGMGFKFSCAYNKNYSIGLAANVTRMVDDYINLHKWNGENRFGYSVSLPFTWSSPKADKWTFIFEPRISSSDIKENRGSLGLGFNALYKF